MKIQGLYDYFGKKRFDFLPDSFPDELLDEQWAQKVHSQSLKRLNERGGLSIIELLMNLNKITLTDFFKRYGYNYEPTESDAKELLNFLPKSQP